MVLQQVEIPPGYAGDSINSWARVQRDQQGARGMVHATFSDDFSPAVLMSLRVGDQVQFNHQGPLRPVAGGSAGHWRPVLGDFQDGLSEDRLQLLWFGAARVAQVYLVVESP